MEKAPQMQMRSKNAVMKPQAKNQKSEGFFNSISSSITGLFGSKNEEKA